MAPLLQVKNLRTEFTSPLGVARAVDGVGFELDSGQTLGLVGESGCGKSVTALSIMRLIPSPPGRIVGGEVIFKGRDLLKLEEEEMRTVRGNQISMIFQEPMTSLNPVFTVGDQIMEVIRLHQGLKGKEAEEKAAQALHQVGIPSPQRRLKSYPHQMSGGMRQRVMIAMAISCGPELMIADEPTTALDVTIQAQIMELIEDLQKKTGLAMLLITHNLGVVAETADEVAVMYLGQIVERAPVKKLFAAPLHPYTQALLASLPNPEAPQAGLSTIEGTVPSIFELPVGCRFKDRCPQRFEACDRAPDYLPQEEEHLVRCHLYA